MAFDIVDLTERYKSNFHSFYLDPQAWRSFVPPVPLSWTKVRFEEANLLAVPTARGIYTFTVAHLPSHFPDHGYVLYAGITGDSSRANLRKRYNEYLQYQRSGKGRPHVIYMLRKWPDDLFFSYCSIPNPKVSLASLETELLGALSPPVNKRDFPAIISAARKARF